MKKKPVNEDSDEFEADEPEEFEESGSDWDPEEEPASKKRKPPPAKKAPAKKAAPAKKKKAAEKPPSDDEEEEEEGDEEEEEDGEDSEESEGEGNSENGSFVVLKTDFTAGGNPPLWKIDGKALLQKFIPFEQDGKTLYKNTSTYSGWTQNNRNQYTAAPVSFIVQGKKEVIIEFNRDKVDLEDKKEDDKKETATA